ncbi:arylamine N-acetyltransferase family protein [Streptomyces sp. URMC 123]|uniref:arylamine N-acetyltransferase family protein n=1 Tax=Streptomyces sp. URMC 123 TaxID=3423403 RepID=UPI003F1BD363
MSDAVWGAADLDLDAYLSRIGLQGPLEPTLDTLRSVHRAHTAAIPFENLEIILGRPILLGLDDLQAKMVHRRRGGYCYEQNLLLAAALERMGFEVHGLGGRVRMGSERLRPVTHMMLRVRCEDQYWLADVGFGGDGLLEPLPLRHGARARQERWTFALEATRDGGGEAVGGEACGRETGGRGTGEGETGGRETFVLRTLRDDGWLDLYSFTLERQYPVDYAVMNYYISTHPRSPFTGRPVVQRREPGARHTLLGAHLSIARPGQDIEERDLEAHEWASVLARHFGIELSPADVERLRDWRPGGE